MPLQTEKVANQRIHSQVCYLGIAWSARILTKRGVANKIHRDAQNAYVLPPSLEERQLPRAHACGLHDR